MARKYYAQGWDHDLWSVTVYRREHRFLWWTWEDYLWLVYFYNPGSFRWYRRVEGYADTFKAAKSTAFTCVGF